MCYMGVRKSAEIANELTGLIQRVQARFRLLMTCIGHDELARIK